ncbi:MAG: ABC transporter permease, partial [Bacteroidota bacterium]
MIKNLLIVALRNFKRDKGYSLLNIIGLTIGITFSLFLIFYIKDELSYDRYNKNAENIYRINAFIKEKDKDVMKWTSGPFPLGPALKKDYPEVEEMTRFVGNGKTMYKNGQVKFYEDKVFYTDSTVFKIFTCQFIEGNPQTALVQPNSIVLSQTLAEKYFGKNISAVGRVLQNEKNENFTVTAVIKDVPKNSHIIFNVLVSITTLPKDFSNNFGNFNTFNYVLLRPNTNAAAFEKKLQALYDKYLAAVFKQFNIKIDFNVQNITSIHLHSDIQGEPEELGSISYIYIFAAVAFFMLLIACINYMNLATARSARRAKEIGIRKVSGSTQLQLVAQFLVESTLTAFFSLLLSIGFIALFLPSFNSLAGKFISFKSLLAPGTFLILLAIILFVGLIGGSYPAFYLAKFNPVNILKGSLSKGSSNATLRRILVVVQFSISMIMIICTWVVYSQLKYLQNVDLGFNKDQVLSVTANADSDIRSKILAFKDAVRSNPQVLSISTSQNAPGSGNINFSLFTVETKDGFKDQGVDTYAVDEDYFRTLGMQLKKGRNFTGLSDTLRSIIVNENFVKYFKWNDDAIGKKVKRPGDTSGFYYLVVGVIKDFNQKSLYNPIAPLLLQYRPNNNIIQLKLSGKNVPAAIGGIENVWKTALPDLPFQYTFLDQDFDSQYAADQKRGKIFTAFSVLTIMITCLGLLGLVAFTTQQRQKEISIRKILGASVKEIIPLITNNFILLVGISCLVAFPVAWLFMSKWLKVFPYNTGITVTPFLFSAIAVLAITMLTVIFHTIRAAVANPVK